MLTAPYDQPVNLAMQDVMNYASYGLTLALFLATLRKGTVVTIHMEHTTR